MEGDLSTAHTHVEDGRSTTVNSTTDESIDYQHLPSVYQVPHQEGVSTIYPELADCVKVNQHNPL